MDGHPNLLGNFLECFMYKGSEALVRTRACHTSCVVSFTLLKSLSVE